MANTDTISRVADQLEMFSFRIATNGAPTVS